VKFSEKALKAFEKTAKVSEKAVSTGIKGMQITTKGLGQMREFVENRTPSRYLSEKAKILEKLCLGYWGEKMGGMFDPPAQTVWKPDPEFINQKNEMLRQCEAKSKQIQHQLSQVQRDIDRKELTEYQMSVRKKNLKHLQSEKRELEEKILIQKEQDGKRAEAQFHESVKNRAEQAVRNFRYTLDKRIQNMVRLLHLKFKNYWKNEMKSALKEHEDRLKSLENSLKIVPAKRHAGSIELDRRINMIRVELKRQADG
jgi:hypothetical protein